MRERLVFISLLAALATASSARAGDAGRGGWLYLTRCAACHSPDRDRTGPHHRGLVGRRVASAPGYGYSRALAAQSFVWSAATLDRWLENPGQVASGTAMTTRVANPRDRADLIAYLQTLGPER